LIGGEKAEHLCAFARRVRNHIKSRQQYKNARQIKAWRTLLAMRRSVAPTAHPLSNLEWHEIAGFPMPSASTRGIPRFKEAAPHADPTIDNGMISVVNKGFI